MIELPQNTTVFEKTKFSMITPEVENHIKQKHPEVTDVVLFGIEVV